VIAAMGLVYTKHESRKLFIELEALTDQRDELNIEWGQLQIEQSTWATHARIEQVATDELKLTRPEATGLARAPTGEAQEAEEEKKGERIRTAPRPPPRSTPPAT